MGKPVEMPFGMWTRIRPNELCMWGEKGTARVMPGHVWRSIYTQKNSEGSSTGTVHADADWFVGLLDGSVYWRHLANTIELSVCGGDVKFL